MKKKELNNLRTKGVEELQKLLNEKMSDAIQSKVKMKVSKEKNLKHVKMLRRDISQISTLLEQKKFESSVVEEKEDKS